MAFQFNVTKQLILQCRKNCCINIRYVASGKAKAFLYKLAPVTCGNAETLFKVIKELFDNDNSPWDKLVGYASDGENLMQGTSNSVLTRMQ